MLLAIREFMTAEGIEYLPDALLRNYSSVRIGNAPTLMAFPHCEEQLITLLRFVIKNKIRFKIVGGITNLLPSDNRYDGIIISTLKMKRLVFDGSMATAEAGVRLSAAIAKACERSLGGLEALISIPGTLGGAVYSNAGAYGSEISDFLHSVRLYSIKDNVITALAAEQMKFGYRDSILRVGEYCLLSANILFRPSDKENVRTMIKEFKQRRAATQPVGAYSLGSVFKRADGVSAAYYIDRAGLKGYTVGGAQISEKHAGFIINIGGATDEDYKRLVSVAEGEVYRKFGIALEREVEYL